MSAALWLLGAGVGLFAIVMVLSLCIVAAKPTPTPPGPSGLTLPLRPRTIRGRTAEVWMDYTQPAAELQTRD